MTSKFPGPLVLGTHNQKKRQELEHLLAGRPIELLTLDDFPNAIEVEETGQTFIENARLKATQQAQRLGVWVLGEDSGLSVAALDGQPGVFSARFAGPEATDDMNNRKLLEQLAHIPLDQRDAWYTCTIALSDPRGNVVLETSGECHGRIVFESRGTNGFGYDPLFEIVEYHRTFGELGPAVKSVLSHRARAYRHFMRKWDTLFA